MSTRNKLIADIVVASGGIVTQPETRNSLLGDWLDANTTRFFRLNEGTTDHYTVPNVATPGDYEFSFPLSTIETAADINVLSLFTSLIGERLQVQVNAGTGIPNTLKIATDGFTPGNGTIVVNDGKLRIITLRKSGNDFSILVNGVLDYTVTHSNPSALASSYSIILMAGKLSTASAVVGNCSGILSDFTVDTDGVLIRSYAIDDNSDTIKDSVGGFDGTVINGNPDDWGLFHKIQNGWRGKSLTVPPWDSINQELIFA